ncbi:hypothetical protein ONS95_006233 [Cadophora gregata]|uniref:uncharacterized protein n=1 Tax=Cadophora gregata TaxID=51156 RepID=UPI0026DD0E0F|nr:uncharacterized protein ONS95_006233 [Cadophora gregata]KAK0102628.1 hypothetical protein ONS95_006233 [Cadophora gregata]KAK0104281.1 hypothetical protein ONS96_005371 [Cadophora gregata f. sp. sojae]
MFFKIAKAIVFVATVGATTVPDPPNPEFFDISQLTLPPAISNTSTGACTAAINPRRTGCIYYQENYDFQSGDFTPDGKHVVVSVNFTGAPAAPDPASIYSGAQVILITADGTNFPNGDAWKCMSCAVPAENKQSLDPVIDYPHVYRGGTKILWGHNVLDCNGELLAGSSCTPNGTNIYPIFWPISTNATARGGVPRELRLHPDDRHILWSSLSANGQSTYTGRLQFNAEPTSGSLRVPRYDLVDVNLLAKANSTPAIYAEGNELKINPNPLSLGELRGWSGNGEEILYLGTNVEANNVDLWAIHVVTGVRRRITSHPEYVDPVVSSADNKNYLIMDTRGSNRQMWMSGMRAIPPILDLVVVLLAVSTRNNGPRRFFQPILLDHYGDRSEVGYYGQRINTAGDLSSGSINDPNWNGRADGGFSLDGTKIVYWQALVTAPSCGGVNPLPCPVSTTEGGANYRVMLAKRIGHAPTHPAPVFKIPDVIPWATPFPPGSTVPADLTLAPGHYTLYGKAHGSADVVYAPDSVSVRYSNYSDDYKHILDGYENATSSVSPPNFFLVRVSWFSDIIQTGKVFGTKKTSPGGFHSEIDAMINIFSANGSLTTTLDGVEHHQPLNFS